MTKLIPENFHLALRSFVLTAVVCDDYLRAGAEVV